MHGATSQSHVRRLTRPLARKQDDGGFTLIELLIVITIIPLIAGALGSGLVTVFSLQSGVSARLGDSSDAQVVAASFTKDVQSASSLTTDSTISSPLSVTIDDPGPNCWGWSGAATSEVASYVEQLQSGTTLLPGAKRLCNRSFDDAYQFDNAFLRPSSALSASRVHARQAPVAYDGSTVIVTSGGLVSTIGMTALQFPITEPKSSYVYHLSATPAGGSSTPQTNLGGPNSGDASCGFALAGTGQLPQTMCFIGFHHSQIQAACPKSSKTCTNTDPGQQGTDVYADIPGGYLMSFCLTVKPGAGESQRPRTRR